MKEGNVEGEIWKEGGVEVGIYGRREVWRDG